MAPQCNLNDRGAKLRLWMGIVTVVIAAVLVAAGVLSLIDSEMQAAAIWGGVVLMALGAFGIYEGLNKWCVAKAIMAKFFRGDEAK